MQKEIPKRLIPADLIREMAVIFAQDGWFDEKVERVTEELIAKNSEALQGIIDAWEGT